MSAAFVDELKQRHVVRVAGIYAVGGWAVFQVVNALFPALGLPSSTVTLTALLFLGGFPVAILLAWLFESTPDGIRFVPSDRRSFGGGRFGWVDWLIAALVATLLGFVAVQLGRMSLSGSGLRSPFASQSRQSVAVLPFASFSSAAEDGYFADGLTEEIINSLAQTPKLKVAGRTSAFYFKDRNEDLREVGRKLGVTNVLEGSVRRAGDQLRVTAQLVKVEDGFHLWSATYDRRVDDALAIQTELAQAVAAKLQAELIGGMAEKPARDADLYRLELVAKGQLRTQELGNLKQARLHFAELRKRDPRSVAGLAGYAQATMLLAQNFLALDFDTARSESEAAIHQALAIDPNSPDAWRAKGAFERVLSIRSGGGGHERLALDAFRRALALAPNDPELKALLGSQYLSRGDASVAAQLLGAALATDPLSRTAQHIYASSLAALGRYDDARRMFEKIMALFPDYTSGRVGYAQMLMFQQGKLDEAATLLDDPKLGEEDSLAIFLLANCYANLGMDAELATLLNRLPAASPAAPIGRAIELQLGGRARDLLAFADRQYRVARDPLWRSLQLAQYTLIGEPAAGRTLLPQQMPGLFADRPDVAGISELDVAIAADILRRTGSPERADAILRQSLARSPAGDRYGQGAQALAARAMSVAAAGRSGEALDLLEQAAKAGWRQPVEFDYFVRIDRYPFMAGVVRDPRYATLMKFVSADLARMRARLRARDRADPSTQA